MINVLRMIIDIVILACAAIVIYYKWKLFRLIRSRAFVLIIAAFVWVTVVRILIILFPGWDDDSESVVGFWIIFAIAAPLMWHDISKWL
jgi:hypothetical protein